MIKKLTNPSLLALMLLATLHIHCNQESTRSQYPVKVITIDPDQAKLTAEKIRQEVAVQLAEGLELTLWASDSLIKDPIAISADPHGGIYYTNGTRLEHSEFDIRGHRDWMTASISFQSVEDRRTFLRDSLSPDRSELNKSLIEDLNGDSSHDWHDLTVEKESVWYMEDRSGDGLADRSQLFIEDFHEEISDLANGVEFFDGNVFISVGPDLWRTRDVDGDGRADEKESLAHGFGVHIGFGAHGMSGATVGPDGRIWWGIGDIGMNVTDKEGNQWKYPNQGVIVRCEPDGSNFEVFAAGLRNTHEFVFDKYGNLISEDNDGDHAGERERLVYITNGSDGGWRINWQFGKYTDPDNNTYKVWMDEKLNIPRWEGQAAHITPPIINYVNGPTGLVYNPGTALGEEWSDHFFVAEFRGSPANSPIHAFTLRPDGASFALEQTREVVSGLLPTGLDFGPDGALYFADWIDGWGVKNKGRLWKLDVSSGRNRAMREEVKGLMSADFSKKQETTLGTLLKHPDMRIRQKAQFELVKREDAGQAQLLLAIKQTQHQLARIHGIWGIAQMARKNLDDAAVLGQFLDDADEEIQAQAAKMIGDVRFDGNGDQLIGLLQHGSPRVRFFAAEALGRTGEQAATQPIIQMLVVNDDQDAWLRHAGILALARIGQAESLMALSNHGSRAARIAGAVALRKMGHPGIRRFLKDQDPYIVTEAARGINDDFSIEAALADLANTLASTSFRGEPLIRRAINANLRVGEEQNLEILINYVLNEKAPDAMRAEALAALSTWAKPSVLDRVDGRYRGVVTRDESLLRKALIPLLPRLLKTPVESLVVAAIDASARLRLDETAPLILALVKKNQSKPIVLAALTGLEKIGSPELGAALQASLSHSDPEVRSKALGIIPSSSISDTKAMELFESVLKSVHVEERQAALSGLSQVNSESANQLIAVELRKLIAGNLDPAVHLDVIEAAKQKENAELATLLTQLANTYDPTDSLASYRTALVGGNPRKGRQIFYRNEAAQCVRCHSIWEYGGDAGPSLMGVAGRLSPEKILTSVIYPSADLAAGYGVISLELKDGSIVAGIVEIESETQVKLRTGNDKIVEIEKAQIAKRYNIPSSMPSIAKILSARQVRDLVAFLSDLKDENQAPPF